MLSRRTFLALSGLACAAPAFAAPRGKPNIVHIILDELGYYELSCMGNKHLKTPGIDRMAAEGMRFTRAYGGGPVCAPTRSTLMTGQHTGHTTVRGNSGSAALREDDVTIASLLKSAGYATGGFGKWGLGGRGTSGVPEKHGFDLFFGYYDQLHAHTYFPAYLIRNSEEVPLKGNTNNFYTGETFAQDAIFAETTRFIRDHANEPFFCYCAWTLPHGRWGIRDDSPYWQAYKDKDWRAGQSRPTDAKIYAAYVAMLDDQIAQIRDLLEALGIANETLVIVSGDNGGDNYFTTDLPANAPGAQRYPRGFFEPNTDPKTGATFREQKGAVYEGGLRIPMVACWPGTIPPGKTTDHITYFPDFMPTYCQMAGADIPQACDGLSLLPLFTGSRAPDTHPFMYWEYQGRQALRRGDWKYIGPIGKKGKIELFNIALDPEEKNDLAAHHPDIVEALRALAAREHTPMRPGTVYPNQPLTAKDQKQAYP